MFLPDLTCRPFGNSNTLCCVSSRSYLPTLWEQQYFVLLFLPDLTCQPFGNSNTLCCCFFQILPADPLGTAILCVVVSSRSYLPTLCEQQYFVLLFLPDLTCRPFGNSNTLCCCFFQILPADPLGTAILCVVVSSRSYLPTLWEQQYFVLLFLPDLTCRLCVNSNTLCCCFFQIFNSD